MKKIIRKLMPVWAFDLYHKSLAYAGAWYYGFPSRRMKVIGITGTKGKTSTSYLIIKILEGAGMKVGAVTGLLFKVGEKEEPNKMKMTMPGRFFIQKKLREMADAGCTYAVVEVTSEGIKQHRHEWIDFDTAVFTNVAPEHLEAHGGFDRYKAKKEKLFALVSRTLREKNIRGKKSKMQKTIIVNGDDKCAQDFISYAADKKYSCHVGRHDEDEEVALSEEVVAKKMEIQMDGSSFEVNGTKIHIHLSGAFNIMNSILAIAVGISEGCSLPGMAESLSKIKSLPGRMEIMTAPQGFRICVDYAHTPDSLDKVYEALIMQMEAGNYASGMQPRLICVLGGTGGGRDKWKRPLLGAIAGIWGDEIIITDEDPYDENPVKIMTEVFKGVKDAKHIYEEYFGPEVLRERKNDNKVEPRIIEDRKQAIVEALKMAKKGDFVAITGKGAEQVMAVAGGQKIPHDDREIVRNTLAQMSGL